MEQPSPGAEGAAPPPAWLDEIDPMPAPPFLAMGVRALGPGRWLTVGDTAARREKERVLDRHRGEVLVALPGPGTREAARELVGLVTADVEAASDGAGDALAAANRAEADAVTGGEHGDTATAASGDGPDTATATALERAALLVAEDLCLLVGHNGAWVLGAGCVCFPSHWRLGDKVGRPVAEIHAPVPHYAAELAGRVDRFLDRLGPDRPVWRRNWLVHTDDRLFAPVPAPPPTPPLTPDDAGDRLWLRSERQTLRRLPRTGAVVFTIRTQQVPLRAVRARPELRARMAAAAATWSPELIAYRGGPAVHAPLLAWLRGGGEAS